MIHDRRRKLHSDIPQFPKGKKHASPGDIQPDKYFIIANAPAHKHASVSRKSDGEKKINEILSPNSNLSKYLSQCNLVSIFQF